MASMHVKYMRCLVWQNALRYWKEFRDIMLAKILIRIKRLLSMIKNFKIEYNLLNEPQVNMIYSYKIANYYQELKVNTIAKRKRKMRWMEKYDISSKEVTVETDEEGSNIAAVIDHICTGGESQDEFEVEDEFEEEDDVSSAPNKNQTGTDEIEQQSSKSNSASRISSSVPNEKHTGTDEFGQQISGSPMRNEKCTGTTEKTIKRSQRPCKEVGSASNIQVPQTSKISKHVTAVQDPLIRRQNGADDEKSSKQVRKKEKFRNTGDNAKICGGKDEDGEGPTSSPRSSRTELLGKQPLVPKPTEVDYDIDKTMHGRIKNYDDLLEYIHTNRYVSNGVEWMILGSKKTKLEVNVVCDMDWTASGNEITQQLLVLIFGLETLATHNRTGGPMARLQGDMPIAEMPKLNVGNVVDLIQFMSISKGMSAEETEKIIDKKCAELFQAKLHSEMQRRKETSAMNRRKKGRKPQRKHGKRR